jgi:hypothetical protein
MSTDVLTLRFESADKLVEQSAHAEQGGLFVPCPDPAPPVPSDVRVRIESVLGAPVEFAAQVVQVFPAGMALTFVDAAAAQGELAPLFEAARTAGDAGGAVVVEWLVELAPDAIEAEAAELSLDDIALEEKREGTLFDQIRAMSVPQKRNLALKGERAARLLLIKDVNKTLQTFLLKNPRITIDEVKLIASDRQANPEALKIVSENRIWLQNPSISTALVRNPKTPSSIAIRLLDRVPFNELRHIAKSGGAGRAVVQAAKKKVIGNK